MSVHWRAHCHAKWPRGGKEFQHPPRIESMSPNSLNHWAMSSYWSPKKRVHDSRYLATWNQPLLCMQDCCSRISLVEYQGQTSYIRILQCKPLIDTSFGSTLIGILPLHRFCSMLIEQLINLKKVRSENLKFRTDLQNRVMDGWSVTQ